MNATTYSTNGSATEVPWDAVGVGTTARVGGAD